MKKFVFLSAIVGLSLASCTATECLECTGAAASYNSCSNDSQFSLDPAFWDNHVTNAVNYAAGIGDSCTVSSN
ncbi:MAG: hypothetical protein O3C32_00185 [Bacteroidetes bacterium]|nr:hypothetical protein [Bacteroidota bacterium]